MKLPINTYEYKLIEELKPGECCLISYTDFGTGKKITDYFLVVDMGDFFTPIVREKEPEKICVVDMGTGQLVMLDKGLEVLIMHTTLSNFESEDLNLEKVEEEDDNINIEKLDDEEDFQEEVED